MVIENNMNIEQIWAEYKTDLKRFLQSKVSIEADVEDLLQDILIKSYNNLNSLKDKSSIKPWLFQIANNTINDFYRKKYRDSEAVIENVFHIDDSNITKQQLLNCIAPFISALPEKNAALLRAIDLDNQSQKNYAKELGISYSTLKSRVQKSRLMLKLVFDKCCHFKLDRTGNIFEHEKK